MLLESEIRSRIEYEKVTNCLIDWINSPIDMVVLPPTSSIVIYFDSGDVVCYNARIRRWQSHCEVLEYAKRLRATLLHLNKDCTDIFSGAYLKRCNDTFDVGGWVLVNLTECELIKAVLAPPIPDYRKQEMYSRYPVVTWSDCGFYVVRASEELFVGLRDLGLGTIRCIVKQADNDFAIKDIAVKEIKTKEELT